MTELRDHFMQSASTEPPLRTTTDFILRKGRSRRRARVLLAALSGAATVAVAATLIVMPQRQSGGGAVAGTPTESVSVARERLVLDAQTAAFDAMKARVRGLSEAYGKTFGLTVESVEGACCTDPSSPRGFYKFDVALRHGNVKTEVTLTASYQPQATSPTSCPPDPPLPRTDADGCSQVSAGGPTAIVVGGRGPNSAVGRVLQLARPDGTYVTVAADVGDQPVWDVDAFLSSLASEDVFDLRSVPEAATSGGAN